MNIDKIDFVVPVYNEEESLALLFDRIKEAVANLSNTGFRIIFIDDGSTDKSWTVIEDLKAKHEDHITAIKLKRNKGKAMALSLGFKEATAPIVFTMDADLQDDPKEITKFLEKIEAGDDLVSGWKQKRNDPIDKTLPSKVFNFILSTASGIKLHDFNCGFKCYRLEVVKDISLYGELHRFTPVLASFYGYKIGEVSVEHHARQFGHSKYGFERFAKGLVDLCSVVVFTRYSDRPAHLLGGSGLVSLFLGLAILSYLTVLKIFGEEIGHRPLLLLGILLVIFAIQLISIGIVSELIVRNSHYSVRDEDFVKKTI